MPERTPTYSIIMAAGKGRRMRNNVIHKVCFQVAGVPAIHRALDAYNRLGISRNVVVVGELAGQVVETVGRKFGNAVFAYQPEARGTGDAARCGMEALSDTAEDARVLVAAGDKILNNSILAKLFEDFERTDADLAFVVSPSAHGASSAGRVLFAADRPSAIVEMADIRLRTARRELQRFLEGRPDGDVPLEELQSALAHRAGESVNLDTLFGNTDFSVHQSRQSLLERLSRLPTSFDIGSNVVVSPDAAEQAEFFNESVYLVKRSVLEYGLGRMHSDNAQGEFYLTDAVNAVLQATDGDAPRYRVCHTPSRTPHEVMSYNDPEELLRIEDYFHGERRQTIDDLRERLGDHTVRPVSDWLHRFPADEGIPEATASRLKEFYGDDPILLAEKCAAFRAALEHFGREFGFDRSAIVVRSPGRINIMGRHIDWQGGRCNLMAVNQEVIMVVAPRSDDQIEARNVDSDQFPNASISIGGLVSRLDWDNWLSLIDSSELVRHLRDLAGNWTLYIEAALLRLQMAFRDRLLRGMDLAVFGDIPVAAGMSSSSALVVATAESAIALHDIDVTAQQFVNFCGEGEWFVGTRGGSADHAAMKYGRRGTINHVGFHEFELIEQISLPDSHSLVVCNSFVQAKKAAGAKDAFNSRVASYLVGVELIKQRFPQYAPFIRFVRDVNPETLRVPLAKIYEILLDLPEAMTAHEVRAMFSMNPVSWQTLSPLFQDVRPDLSYPVRGVVMFGISECARAQQAAECLKDGDLSGLGRLMKISHDGERCFQLRNDGTAHPYVADVSDAAIRELIEALGRNDPESLAKAQLYNQPGAYRCSTREIDAIVDIACRSEGVEGAQIAGAGLGGCAMVLVRTNCVPQLEARLIEEYYRPNGLSSGVIRCKPSAGSCIVSVN